jgi:hypothetical protein
MKNIVMTVCMSAALTGCGLVPNGLKKPATLAADAVVSETAQASTQTRPQARPASAPQTTTPESAKPAVAAGGLGSTVASLGSPAEPGLWLKTPLVSTKSSGKVSYNGKTIDVTLIPIEGPATAGSRMSLQGFQALGAPLTDLVEVQVST